MSTESDEEPSSVSVTAGTSGVTRTIAKWKATETSSVAKKNKRPKSQGTWKTDFQKVTHQRRWTFLTWEGCQRLPKVSSENKE